MVIIIERKCKEDERMGIELRRQCELFPYNYYSYELAIKIRNGFPLKIETNRNEIIRRSISSKLELCAFCYTLQ